MNILWLLGQSEARFTSDKETNHHTIRAASNNNVIEAPQWSPQCDASSQKLSHKITPSANIEQVISSPLDQILLAVQDPADRKQDADPVEVWKVTWWTRTQVKFSECVLLLWLWCNFHRQNELLFQTFGHIIRLLVLHAKIPEQDILHILCPPNICGMRQNEMGDGMPLNAGYLALQAWKLSEMCFPSKLGNFLSCSKQMSQNLLGNAIWRSWLWLDVVSSNRWVKTNLENGNAIRRSWWLIVTWCSVIT